MATRSNQETIADWEVLSVNLGPQIDTLPHLKAEHEALQALLTDLKALESEQEIHKSALRDTNQKRVELMQRGRDVTSRLIASLRGHFGLQSEELIRYGIKPRPREIRRRFVSKAEKAARLAAEAARAAAAAEAEKRLQEALQASNDNVPAKAAQTA